MTGIFLSLFLLLFLSPHSSLAEVSDTEKLSSTAVPEELSKSIELASSPLALALSSDEEVALIESLDKPFDLSPYLLFIDDAQGTVNFEQAASADSELVWQKNQDTLFVAKNQDYFQNLRYTGMNL